MRLATTGKEFQAVRWCRSMVGEEYARVRDWGGHPDTAVRSLLRQVLSSSDRGAFPTARHSHRLSLPVG